MSQMDVLIVSAVFEPEPVVSAQTSAQLARALRSRGCSVRVLTAFPSRPTRTLFKNYKRRLIENTTLPDGVHVIRCFTFFSSKSSLLDRGLENISFGLISGWYVLAGRRPDVVYANTWPIFATWIITMIAAIRRIPVVLSIQDLYPEALFEQNRLKSNSPVIKVLQIVEKKMVNLCSHVIAISERFSKVLVEQRLLPKERVTVVPNWIDVSKLNFDVEYESFRSAHGVTADEQLLVYGGNVGRAAGVENLIEAMKLLKNEKIKLLVAGEGAQLDVCRTLAVTMGSNKVMFHSPWKESDTALVLGAADLLVLPTKGMQSLTSVPSKALSYMLSGRPILAIAVPGSDLEQLIVDSGCGWVIGDDSASSIADAVRRICSGSTEDRQTRGDAGRQFVRKRFSKELCIPEAIGVIVKAAQTVRSQ